ncbi:hypothetical protein GCM10010182_16330 [Actinomadura cremea]|nr:hypothetical protein GCM10010182_16330 [Actinomadura cremea]
MDDQQRAAVSALLRGAAERIVEGAPAGWRRARVREYYRESGSGGSGRRYETDGGDRDLRVSLGLRKLYAASGATGGEVMVDLVVEPSGRYEAVVGTGLHRSRDERDRILYVLRPHDLPDEPGAEEPPPADPTFAGDPEEAVRLFREYLRKRGEILGEEERLPDPLPEDERTALLDAFHGELPPDLAALYGEADGDEETGLFHGHPWFDLESVTTHVHHHEPWTWTDEPLWSMPGGEPPGKVRRWSSSLDWVPFATSTGGDYLAVDLDPGPDGRPGQVIRMGRNYGGAPLLVADSVTHMLRRLVAAIDRGDREDDDGYLDVNAEPPSYLDSGKAFWRGHAPIPSKPERIQHLAVDKVEDPDLSAVRRAPHLRAVTLFGAGPVDLTPLLDAPIEALRLELDTVDLDRLEGHPTLRAVRLRTVEPADLDVLRTFPRLEGLDLAGAAVRDIGVVRDLRGLLSLTLSIEQWRELGEPPPVAAAGLVGDVTPGRVHAWTAGFGPAGPPGGAEYYAGSVRPEE